MLTRFHPLQLVRFAKKRAERLAQIGALVHESGGRGENLAWWWSSAPNSYSQPCADVVKSWYDEVHQYDFNNPGFNSDTGHFTQVVWKGTTRIGCAQLASAEDGVYTVCNYMQPGNVYGQYWQNVKRSRH